MLSRSLFAILTISIIQSRTSFPGLFAVAKSGTSVCRQYHRINETREESFVEEYYKNVWGSLVLATRINFRTNIIPKWIMVEMCCEGYEPSQHDESPEHCVPVCPSGCNNGLCRHPNSCDCNPGYEASVDNVTRISECLPQCSTGCVGGKCIAPETCLCNVGYDLVDESTRCKPICLETHGGGPENCGDEGVCIAPGECQCRDGYGPQNWMSEGEGIVNRTKPIYRHVWEIDCFPVCEQRCPENAVCTAPNTCSCKSGYKPGPYVDKMTECLPHCEQPCHNGFCAHPDICQCDDGYTAHESLGSNYCEPVCPEDCVNGKCVKPNQCECLSGYEKLIVQSENQTEVASANVCIPSCVADCGHGTCVAPNRCHCDPGYALELVDSWYHHQRPDYRSWQSCMPVCEPSCKEDSQCIAPNLCSCEPGHDRAINSTICKPSCSAIKAGGPENCGEQGICVAPNECQCRDGYAPLHWMNDPENYGTNRTKPIFTNRGDIDCFPACVNPCPENAACIAPNTCHCVNGYRPNDLHFLTDCLPICESSCDNGFCAHPNVCQCHDGYKKIVKLFGFDFCHPICEDICINGTCVGPNECACLHGYDYLVIPSGNQTKLSPNICAPFCYPECGNGTCVAPFECDCNPGYVFKDPIYYPEWSVPKACQPSCNPPCHDELFCVAPNKCQLLDPNPGHLQNFKVKIVEFPSKECGHAGSFSERNNTCMCNYRSDISTECAEPFLCAITILNDAQSAEKFSLLERIVVLDRTNDIPELHRSTVACQNECRISIFSNESLEDIRNETEQCYAMNLHDSRTGLMFNVSQNLLLISERNTSNGSFICFVNAGFRCSSPSYDERKNSRAVNTGVIAGAVSLIALIFAIALSIYLTRRKIRKMFKGSPQKDESMMDRSEAMDSSFHTDDVSHL